jgi:hypothetical protein
VLKKMIAAGGLLVTAASGTAIATPALAQTPMWGGGCCSSANSHSSFFQHHRNRNWNGSENEAFNHIRLHIHNRNNNIAVARNEEEPRRRD